MIVALNGMVGRIGSTARDRDHIKKRQKCFCAGGEDASDVVYWGTNPGM